MEEQVLKANAVKKKNVKNFVEETNFKSDFDNYKRKNSRNYAEIISEKFFFFCALMAVICVAVITLFIFKMGLPAIAKIGIPEFILGQKWMPDAEIFGILPMIIGSIYATLGAIIIGVPIGIMTSVFMCEFAPPSIYKIMNPAVELLAGIPSVVYGFFGLVVIVPMIDDVFGGRGAGNSLLAACIILGIMILPTIITTTNTALSAVPRKYKEGSFALGATHIRTIFSVMIPAARSGICSGVVLGIGRAIGETMAVILVAGNSTIIPSAITDPVRTLTANIAIEMGYAYGLHQEALFATGVILFIFIMILNILLHKLQNRGV